MRVNEFKTTSSISVKIVNGFQRLDITHLVSGKIFLSFDLGLSKLKLQSSVKNQVSDKCLFPLLVATLYTFNFLC